MKRQDLEAATTWVCDKATNRGFYETRNEQCFYEILVLVDMMLADPC